MKKHFLFLLAIVATNSGMIGAQEISYRFINFNYKDGLQDKFFYNVLNDKSGMIWVAAGNGLYNYIGNKFVLYRPKNNQTGFESSNLIRSIYLDTDGKIWTAGINSMQWFDPVSKKFTYYNKENQSLKQLASAIINNFFRDSAGNMWIATQQNGIALLNEKTFAVTYFKESKEIGTPENFITKIIETPGNMIWALSNNGLHLINKEKASIQSFRIPKTRQSPGDENSFTDGFYDLQFNCIWMGSYGGEVIKFDPATKKFEHFDLYSKPSIQIAIKNGITAITPKSESEIWLSNGGLSIFNKNKHTVIKQIIPDATNEYGFKTTVAGKLFTDKETNLWLCSFNGLSMLPWQNNQWQKVSLIDKEAGNQIIEPLNVCEIPGTTDLFIASFNPRGICYYQSNINKLSIKKIKGNNAGTAIHLFKNKLFISCAKDIFIYEKNTNSFSPLHIRFEGKPLEGPIWRILDDGKVSLLIACPENGFYKYNLSTKKTQHYNIWNIDPKLKPSESSNTIWPSYVDSKGNIWFTRSKYLYFADSNFHFNKVAFNESPKQLSINQPSEIVEDANHHYWVTTKANGIYEWYINKENKEVITNYNTSNTASLPSDYYIRVVKDEQGMLWLGSLSGLVRFNPIQKKVLGVYRKKNGLENDNIDVPLSLLPGNQLVVCNFGSLNLLNINSYKMNKTDPTPLISSFKVMDKLIQVSAKDTTLVFPYNENFLQFELASLCYNNSDENKYAYKLEGIDHDWIFTKRNYVSYSGLSNGNYLFRFKAANNDQLWSKKELQIKIIIDPPFWKTWWFIGLILTAVALVVYLFNQNRVRQIRKEEKLKADFKQQIAETEMKALRAQMNPHFIFNSLNSIQKYILKNEHFEASQYLTNFSRLIRLILDHSNQNSILLSSELELLHLYIGMESLRFHNKFDYEIQVDERVNTETAQVPSMLIQPFVENAIWHGLLHKDEKGKLTLEFYKNEKGNLVVLVDDNGIGREKAFELKSKQVLKKKSYGMQITEDRIKIINRINKINATCEVIDKVDGNGNNVGTIVKLIIPYHTINN